MQVCECRILVLMIHVLWVRESTKEENSPNIKSKENLSRSLSGLQISTISRNQYALLVVAYARRILLSYRSLFKDASPDRNVYHGLCFSTCSIIHSPFVNNCCHGNKQYGPIHSERNALSLPPLDETDEAIIHPSFSLHAQPLTKYSRIMNKRYEYVISS